MPKGKPKETPNKAYLKLKERFGKDAAGYLLWNETCYPFSAKIASEQADFLIVKADQGQDPTLDGWAEQQK